MPTALLKPPNFADEPPFPVGVNGFFVYDTGAGSWHLTGTADGGVAMQNDDALRIDVVNDGTGISSGGALFFKDEGAIPGSSTIISFQLIVKGTFVGANMGVTIQPFNIQWGSIAWMQLVGADTDDFTGSGVFSTAVMTEMPGGGPWVYDDLYGASDPFGDPKGFQGWYGISSVTGSTSTPADSVFQIDSMNLLVDYGEGSQDPTNWDFNSVLHHSREWGVMRAS